MLRPTITFTGRGNDFAVNRLGEKGTPVTMGFEYNSGSNPHFLSVDEIREFNRKAMA